MVINLPKKDNSHVKRHREHKHRHEKWRNCTLGEAKFVNTKMIMVKIRRYKIIFKEVGPFGGKRRPPISQKVLESIIGTLYYLLFGLTCFFDPSKFLNNYRSLDTDAILNVQPDFQRSTTPCRVYL